MNAAENTIITEYLDSHSIYHTINPDGSCSAMLRIADSGRFNVCEATIRCGENTEATVTLPLRCVREEQNRVYKELMSINAELASHECIELDAITGDFRIRRVFANPESPEEFASNMFTCDLLIREYSDRIMQAVSRARKEINDANARQARLEKGKEEYRNASFLKRFIIAIGLSADPRRIPDESAA